MIYFFVAVSLSCAEVNAADFATDRFGQLIEELDFARVLVRCSDTFAMVLQFAAQLFTGHMARAQHDECLDNHAASWVGFSYHRRLDYGWVFDQRTLDFERADAIARAFDDIIASAYEPEEPVLIAAGPVASQVPIALKSRRVLLRVAPYTYSTDCRGFKKCDVRFDWDRN